MPNIDLMALIAFSLINDSSNLFIRGSNSGDVLILARSGSVRILCSTVATSQTACILNFVSNMVFFFSIMVNYLEVFKSCFQGIFKCREPGLHLFRNL